jgi:hypothetical protein
MMASAASIDRKGTELNKQSMQARRFDWGDSTVSNEPSSAKQLSKLRGWAQFQNITRINTAHTFLMSTGDNQQ